MHGCSQPLKTNREAIAREKPLRAQFFNDGGPPQATRLISDGVQFDEIKAMPVRDIADENATLWLWTTNAHLSVAFEVVAAWGFEYKTLLTWVKDRMGTGDWLRGQTEHCLLGARGKPVFLHGNHGTALEAARREHSRKPDEFFLMVEQVCPGSRVELFSRQERDGWQAFGDQVGTFTKSP